MNSTTGSQIADFLFVINYCSQTRLPSLCDVAYVYPFTWTCCLWPSASYYTALAPLVLLCTYRSRILHSYLRTFVIYHTVAADVLLLPFLYVFFVVLHRSTRMVGAIDFFVEVGVTHFGNKRDNRRASTSLLNIYLPGECCKTSKVKSGNHIPYARSEYCIVQSSPDLPHLYNLASQSELPLSWV